MDRTVELYEKYKDIRNPFDYYKGIGVLSMPIPNNVLCFIRVNYGITGLSESIQSHYRYVCIFNFRKPIEIIVDGKLQIVDKGEGLILLPYQYHKFPVPEKEKDIFGVFITFEMEENSFFENFRLNNFKIDSKIVDYLFEFNDCYVGKKTGEIPLQLSLLLLYIYKKSTLVQKELSIEVMKNNLLQKIISMIHSNLHINIIEIAENLGYSENYIRRYFKKKMGITLGSYIIELRISKSLFYLFKKEYLISEIAELCGYETIYSYSRAFKQIMKCSPKQFRLKVNTKPELLNEYRANQDMRIAIKMNNK